MDLTIEVADLRREAESMMTDQVRVTRNGAVIGVPLLDPTTGTYPSITRKTIYTGRAALRVPGTTSTGKIRPTAGDSATILLAILGVPFNAPRILVGDQVLFTASKFNPILAGLLYKVTSLLPASVVTKQRVTVELVAD